MLNPGEKKFPAIIAHRGASNIAPENTLTAVSLAWELNADGVEIDVRLSCDNKIVVIHDATTKRTTGKNFTVSETTSVELRKLDAGILKSKQFEGQRIPFLEEILDILPHDKKLFIEIKCGKEIIPILRSILTESGKILQTAIMGFDFDTVLMSKKIMPEIPVCWLHNTKRNKLTKKTLPHNPEWIRKAKEHNLNGLGLQYAGITEDFAKEANSSGLKLYSWTINHHKEALKLFNLCFNGIITNRPGWILQKLEEKLQLKMGKNSD